MATLQDIADRVGVSKGVVSVYLNTPDTTRVSAETKEKIDSVVEELGYVPNVHARNLSKQRSNLINMLVLFREPLFRNSVVNEILSGVSTVLVRYQIGMVFPAEQSGTLLEMARGQIRSSHGNDGYIVIGTRYSSIDDIHQTVDELERGGAPFVVTNMPDLGRPVNQVLVHGNRSAAAIRHLLDLGHRRILVLGGTPLDPESRHESEVIRRTFAERGIPFDPSLYVYSGYEFRPAKQAVSDALEDGTEFSAIFCFARQMAMGASQALTERGLVVSRDVVVATIAESRFLEFYHFPFVVVETDYSRMGEEAARLLLTEIDCRRQDVEHAVQTIRIESRLVVDQATFVPSTKEGFAHG